MNFADRLTKAIEKKKSALVVGLDTDLQYLPDFLTKSIKNDSLTDIENVIFQFNKIVLDSIHEYAVAVKPQLAYYEIYGSYGIRALERSIEYARSKELIIINDAKRGDIDSTSMAYAKAFLGNGPLSADMVTVNPFLGIDGYKPFVELAQKNNKGIFLLLKTSNQSSNEIQDLKLESGNTVYQRMADNFNKLCLETKGDCGYSFIGCVVAATYPEIASELRKRLPNTIFLVPGLGHQGGKADDLDVFDRNGNGAVINSSRGIIYSYMKEREDWKAITEAEMAESIKKKAMKDNDDLNRIRLK